MVVSSYSTHLIVPDVPEQPLVEELRRKDVHFQKTENAILYDIQLYRSSGEMAPIL